MLNGSEDCVGGQEDRRPLKRFRRSKRFKTSDLQNTCAILKNVCHFQSVLYVPEHSLNNLVRPFSGFELAYLIKTDSVGIPPQ